MGVSASCHGDIHNDLLLAIGEGDLHRVKILLTQKPKLVNDSFSSKGFSPLHYAASLGQPEVSTNLLRIDFLILTFFLYWAQSWLIYYSLHEWLRSFYSRSFIALQWLFRIKCWECWFYNLNVNKLLFLMHYAHPLSVDSASMVSVNILRLSMNYSCDQLYISMASMVFLPLINIDSLHVAMDLDHVNGLVVK